MLSQKMLLKAIDADMIVCTAANPTDAQGRERRILELGTLTNHLEWAKRAGSDQRELERVVKSLETNSVVAGYQHWRELATEKAAG
jgi:hypothetical protein